MISWIVVSLVDKHGGLLRLRPARLNVQMQKSSVVRYIHEMQSPINDVNGYVHHIHIISRHVYYNTIHTCNHQNLFEILFYSNYF